MIEPAGPRSEVAALAEIGRAILEAQLDETQLYELIFELAGKLVPTANFQIGIFDADCYRIKVWTRNGERQPEACYVLPEGQGIMGWIRAHGRPLLVRDFESEMERLPARPVYESESPPRSAIFLPLLAGDTIIGVIAVHSDQPEAFDEDDLRLLTILANQLASALNNARLYASGQRRLNALMGVAEVGSRINRLLDLDSLLTEVVQLIQARFDFYHVQIYLSEPGAEGTRTCFRASSGHGLNEKWRREGRSMAIGKEGIIGWVAKHGEPLLANDVSREPRYVPDDPRLLPDTRAELAVPLLIEEDVIGVLDVQSTHLGAFGEDDVFVLRTLAGQVAAAVASARAFEAQQEEAWTTTVMLQVAEATSQADGVAEVMEAAVRVIAMLAGVESCTIWLWDEEFDAFQYAASYGLILSDAHDPTLALRFLAGEWADLDRMRVEKTPLLLDLKSADIPPALAACCPGDVAALLPMLNKGRVFGVLGVSMCLDRGPRLNERRLAMLAGIAHQVAAVVDNSRLADAQEEEAWVSTVLLQVSEAIGRIQPIDVTLSQIAHLTPLLAGVDRCAILLIDEEGHYRARTVYALHSALAGPYEDAVIRPGELPLLDDACRLGQPMVADDAQNSPSVPDAWRERFASRTVLVVPLILADTVIGAILADDVHSTHMFSPRRVRILSGIASQTAMAIENARLQMLQTEQARLSRELELAHAIQHSLLPEQAPQVPGYEIVYRWRSAGEVGGDFLDFIPLSGGNLGMVIADVSDKGIPAALYMMFARTLLRAVALGGRGPAAVLVRTNELIVTDSSADMFVTAYYSVLDPLQHVLAYASAGHNLALYAPADGGAAQQMTTGGIALGIVAPADIEEKSIALAPGDLVLFYTDGATDALSAGGQPFDEHRLYELLQTHRDEPAETILARIDDAIREFSAGTPQYDDLTLLLLKRLC